MNEHQNRRAGDQVLGLIVQRLDRENELSDQFRCEMLKRTDNLPVLSAKVDTHEKWIENEGKPVIKRVDQAKWISLGLFGAGAGAGVGGTTLFGKLLAAIGLGH